MRRQKITYRLLMVSCLVALLSSCSGGGESDPVEKPGTTKTVAPDDGRKTSGNNKSLGEKLGGHPGKTSSGEVMDALVQGDIPVDPDHRRTTPDDRQLLAHLYVVFSLKPEEFIKKLEAMPSDTRRQLYGFLFCAALKLAAATKGAARGGAPIDVELPKEADELINFSGSKERARNQFFRQLSGEFLVLGRVIKSVDSGDSGPGRQVVERQKANLKMLEMSAPPEERIVWRNRVEKVFPILFKKMLPVC
ncbi:MAG: hypothetical protein GY854_27820 [Deltaproteobacteria bacterium]|nr:hypothetical protein [Deltaproteobacteria bacterium]